MGIFSLPAVIIGSQIDITGAIAIWSGSVVNIPTGWQICDGTNGTPNLQDKFIRGWDTSIAIGSTGGTTNRNHTHTTDQQGSHSHALSGGSHSHSTVASSSFSGGGSWDTGNDMLSYPPFYSTYSGQHTHAGGTSVTHSHTLTDPTDGLPEYYKVVFIMKV